MGGLIDLTGRLFGRLRVVTRAERNTSTGGARWLCQCKCGAWAIVAGRHLLRKGRPTRSCGCLQPEVTKYRLRRAMGRRAVASHLLMTDDEY